MHLLPALLAFLQSAAPSAVTPVAALTLRPEVRDEMQHAVFAEALRMAKPHRRNGLPSGYCLSVDAYADPPSVMLARLAKESGLSLHSLSECRERELFHRESLVLGFDLPTNTIHILGLRRTSATGAVAHVVVLGTVGYSKLKRGRRAWNADCCVGAIAGDPSFPDYEWEGYDAASRPMVAAARPAPTPDVEDKRYAVFTEMLRMAREHSPDYVNPSGCFCLSVEDGGDPTPAMVKRLARESGLTLQPASECLRSKRYYVKPASAGGFTNSVAILAFGKGGPTEATTAEIRVLGGTGKVVLTIKDGVWKGECCEGGLVG